MQRRRSDAEAEPLYRRSLAIREKALGPEHPSVGASFNSPAGLAFEQGDLAQAAEYWGAARASSSAARLAVAAEGFIQG